jgi:hypothetical protein
MIMYFFFTLSATTPDRGSKRNQPSMPAIPNIPIWDAESPCPLMNKAKMGAMIPDLKFKVSWTTSRSLRELLSLESIQNIEAYFVK